MMKWVWRLMKARMMLWATARIRRAIAGGGKTAARRR
jgi:hypothetical protein